MKKNLFYLMAAAALLSVGCQKEEIAGGEQTPSAEGRTLTFVGKVWDETDAKASIGEGTTAGGYQVNWEDGDNIGVYNASSAHRLTIASLDDGFAGKNQGEFTGTYTGTHTGSVVLIHPATQGTPNEVMYYEDGTVAANIHAEQTQTTSGTSAHLVSRALGYAQTSLSNVNDVVDFTLKHPAAYVRLDLKTTEYSDYTLTGATLYAPGSTLAGRMTVKLSDGTVTSSSTDNCAETDYVKVTLRNPVVMGTETKTIWFTTFPVDLSESGIYAIVHMTKGIETITLPVYFSGGQLKAQHVNVLPVSNLNSSLAPSWYEPKETRLLVDGWAYGEANSLMLENGASATVSLKARGDFRKVTEPKKARILHTCTNNWSSEKTNHIISVNGTAAANTLNAENGPSAAIELTDASMTVSVAFNDADYGTVAIYDESDNVLWAFTVWGTPEVSSHTFLCGKEVMDRNLGAHSDLSNWKSKAGYIQWGRPYCIVGSASAFQKTSFSLDSDGKLETAISNPMKYLLNYNGEGEYKSGTYGDWYWSGTAATDRKNDLWGNTDPTSDGSKSIYDPCPKGWRVISPDVVDELESANLAVTSFADNNYSCDYAVDGGTSRWIVASGVIGYIKYGSQNQYFSKNQDVAAIYWSNCPDATDAYKAKAFTINRGNYSLGKTTLDYFNANLNVRVNGGSVRCMKDTENR